MIIFGDKTFRRLLATLSMVCGLCGQQAANRISSRWVWFHIWWIPLFPLGTKKYYDECVACGSVQRVSRDEAHALVGGDQPTTAPAAPATPAAPAPVVALAPATAAVSAIQAGWYTDPRGQASYRWWDGDSWTDHVTRAPVAARCA